MGIPYGRQEITPADIDAVVEVLHSDFLTQGPMVPRFEQAVAQYCGANYAIAVNSATSALHIACLALKVAPGDLVWTSPITFVASANCARYCGADVDFVDIDPRTYNMNVTCLAEKLERAAAAGRLPKVVIPVHLCGQPCKMEAIHALSKQYGFRIIEDASHAIGGRYQAEPIGNGRYSDITIFSFHPVKIITTGEGGMALTNNGALAECMAMLRSHGITREASRFVQPAPGPWYYEQQALGFNYRLTDIQAALGVSQLERLDDKIERRNALARRYDQALQGLALRVPFVQVGNRSAFHLYVVRLNRKLTTKTHRQVFAALRERGIGVNLHYMPVHLQPYYRKLGFAPGQFPEAETYSEEAMTLPLYPGLTHEEQERVTNTLAQIL